MRRYYLNDSIGLRVQAMFRLVQTIFGIKTPALNVFLDEKRENTTFCLCVDVLPLPSVM